MREISIMITYSEMRARADQFHERTQKIINRIYGDSTQTENNRRRMTDTLCPPPCNVTASHPRAPAVATPRASERTRPVLFLSYISSVIIHVITLRIIRFAIMMPRTLTKVGLKK